jgi:hypothetical protein
LVKSAFMGNSRYGRDISVPSVYRLALDTD